MLACVAFFIFAPKNGSTALIYLDGELFTEIDLTNVSESYTMQIGTGNIILIEPGQVSMYWADCPDGLCIKQGAVSSPIQPIVCLPNKVMIIVENEKTQQADAITGGTAS